MNCSKLPQSLIEYKPKMIEAFTEGTKVRALEDTSAHDFRTGLKICGQKTYSMIDAFIAATGTQVEEYTPEFSQKAQSKIDVIA